MIRSFIIFSILFLSLFFTGLASPVLAEVKIFRVEIGGSAEPCLPISLNDQFTVTKRADSTGAGCDFTVDVRAGGEWVTTGSYFDSPPYAWKLGEPTSWYPTFWHVSWTGGSIPRNDPNDKFAILCWQPNYTISKPDFITQTSVEEIPNGDQYTPRGRKYSLKVGDPGDNKDFNITFGYNTKCTFETQYHENTSIVFGNSRCHDLPIVAKNTPRSMSKTETFSIGATCNVTSSPTPTPTPVSSATPTPTPTPVSSATPTPTPVSSATPTPTPTPTPRPVFNKEMCTCDYIVNTPLFSGQDAIITSYAKVVGEDIKIARVVNQRFFLAKGTETSGHRIAQSTWIPSKTVLPISSSKVRYQSEWKLKMPQLESGVIYRLWSEIDCKPKVSAYNNISSLADKIVLGEQTKLTSFWNNIINFFKSFFKSSNAQSIKTIQLQTFTPVNIVERSCSFIKIKVGS